MEYYTVTYEVEGPDIADAAHNIAIGQSHRQSKYSIVRLRVLRI